MECCHVYSNMVYNLCNKQFIGLDNDCWWL